MDDVYGTSEGSNTTPLDKNTMDSIVNTIKQNIIDEKLYGDEIESCIKNVTATEALFNEVEPLYSIFCKNKNQDKLLKDAVQSDLRMCTKEPSFYLQTVYLGFYFILCSCKA